MNWTEFTPKFNHLITLIICVISFSAGASILEKFDTFSAILYACAAFCGVVAWAWVRMLMLESSSRRAVAEQEAERENMKAVIEFARVMADRLPPAALLAAISRAFPGLDLDQVQLPDEGVQEAPAKDGWNFKRGIPWGLATADQYRILAAGYFDQRAGLPIRYWTETRSGQAGPVFSRKQFEKILEELLTAGMATRSAGGETMLNESGEEWLRQYYSPTPDGFSPYTRFR